MQEITKLTMEELSYEALEQLAEYFGQTERDDQYRIEMQDRDLEGYEPMTDEEEFEAMDEMNREAEMEHRRNNPKRFERVLERILG